MDSDTENQKDPCLNKTHFLKPYVTSINGLVAELPYRRQSLHLSSSELEVYLSTKVTSTGFRLANRDFKSWAKKMEALHEPTWRKAGIFEAIKASTYNIPKNPSLVLALVEKWCPETKSFVFPWGEATITLEDVMVLLGFSVLGSPVFAPLESLEMRDAMAKLKRGRVENRSRDGRVCHRSWISSFRNIDDDDDQIEHEAFLTLWLSDFVFPDAWRLSISGNVLPIAVRLARGEKIALAPAVLASLYRDLSRIHGFARCKSKKRVKLQSLFKLVQVWIWERFRNIRPEAIEIQMGEPRIARWCFQNHKCEKNEILSFDGFDWRPYAKSLKNWSLPKFYVEEAKWVSVDESLDDEFVSFARCFRVSKLAGIGFVEDYYPNRVAMQFGFSQDLPGLVTHHSDNTEKEAWDDYNKSLDGLKLYVPSRLATTSFTARYQDWWLKSVSEFNAGSNTVDNDDDASSLKLPERFPAKIKRSRKRRKAKNVRFEIKKGKIGGCGGSASREVTVSELLLVKRTSERLRNKRCKRAREEDDDSSMNCDDVNITIAEMIKSRKKTRRDDASKSLGKRSRLEDNNNDSGLVQKPPASEEIEPRTEVNDEAEETGIEAEKITVMIPSNENNSSDHPLVACNGGIVETAVSPQETEQNCDVNGSSTKEKTMVDVGTKEDEYLIDENGENQREKLCSEAKKENDVDERLKQRKLAIEEISLKLEARMMKVEKSLVMIRDWKTRGNILETFQEDLMKPNTTTVSQNNQSFGVISFALLHM